MMDANKTTILTMVPLFGDANRSGHNPHFVTVNCDKKRLHLVGDDGTMSSDKLSFCDGGGPTLNAD